MTHASSTVQRAAGTARRRLHKGRSLWADSSGIQVPHIPLEHDLMEDVVVVGAGISGALVAYALMRAGRGVTLLDRREPVHGSTLASTALLQFEIDLPLHRLARRVGWPKAQRAYARSVQAVHALGALVQHEEIACDWEPRDTLYLAGDRYGARAMQEEVAARTRLNIPGTLLSAADLYAWYGIERTAAIASDHCAVADPARLTAGILRRLVASGSHIYSHADVVGVESGTHGVEITTAAGPRVHANQVVFCTGYELPTGVPVRTPARAHHIRSTWAMASEPGVQMPAWLEHTLVWEGSDPYLYLRTTADGRIVAGGHDERAASAYTSRRLMAKLRMITDDVHDLLPALQFRPEYAWGGAFGESSDALPIIDRLPDVRHAWVVAGFGGNGITFSMIASQVIAAALDGGSDPDADLFTLR